MTKNEEIFKCTITEKICKRFNIDIRQVKKKEDLEENNIIATFKPKKIVKIKSRSF